LKRVGILIKNRQLETALFQFHVIDHQTAAFHVQDFHAGTLPVDKDVNVTVLYIAAHLVGHHPAQGVKTPAHIRWVRIQVIPHRASEAEHTTGWIKVTATVIPEHQASRSALHSPRSDSLFHTKKLPDYFDPKTGSKQGVSHFQKTPGQILVWVAVVLLACFASNRIWPRSSDGWRNNPV
jgi:hypothetical protein